MERKIQSVGTSSFSVSLPKKWVEKSNLDAKSTVFFKELNDGSLLISPAKAAEKESLKKFSINVDDYKENFGQIVFAAYYLGSEEIIVYSDKKLSDKVKSELRDTVSYMSGTEIVFEEEKKMHLHILLDRAKINANNIISRISLIIDSSINSCLNGPDMKEINRNEEEIDRLYHLASKIILLSLADSNTLATSGIKHRSLAVPYLLISKKLENVADSIEDLAKILKANKGIQAETSELLQDIKSFVKLCTKFPSITSEYVFSIHLNEETQN